jgi:hypothetical protein
MLELCWRDMTDPAAGEKPPKGKIEEVRVYLRKRAGDTGWLPPQLRTPSYAGPAFTAPAKADEEEDEQLQAAE